MTIQNRNYKRVNQKIFLSENNISMMPIFIIEYLNVDDDNDTIKRVIAAPFFTEGVDSMQDVIIEEMECN